VCYARGEGAKGVRDTLSEVLSAVRLKGAIFFAFDMSEPWAAQAPTSREVGPIIMPGVEHVIEYHVILEGTCWGGLLGEAPVRLEAGDIVAFPQGDPHVISSDPGVPCEVSWDAFHAAAREPLPVRLSIQGGGKEQTKIICGFLGCDAKPFNPLLSTLPRMIHVRGSADPDSTLRKLVELAVAETRGRSAGSDCVLSRVSELLFVEVVRHYTASLPSQSVGFLAGLSDPNVGRALALIHQRPAFDWSVEELAKGAGLSRSTLAERFTERVGIPPMQYLAQWRIQLAASLLRSSTSSLAEIATQVGYGSEFALSRAFKRAVGSAPAAYRRNAAISSGEENTP
jgi:AraC-like DNA-binding protein